MDSSNLLEGVGKIVDDSIDYAVGQFNIFLACTHHYDNAHNMLFVTLLFWNTKSQPAPTFRISKKEMVSCRSVAELLATIADRVAAALRVAGAGGHDDPIKLAAAAAYIEREWGKHGG